MLRIIVLLCGVLGKILTTETPLVYTHLGKIQGTERVSHTGKKFFAFEGIPYAMPPIGDRRFELPEPIQPWFGTWDGKHPTVCPQVSMLNPDEIFGSEDCLHLNVYAPANAENLPVIVHIHGGAFIIGHGNLYCHPRFLMDHDVVFVTFNYRLGILGFLSTEDDTVPGNMGLKDQVLALKWVQEHIKSFGGDPSSVTLTGVSAGGASTHLHYFSDMSKGLFHRGFAQSGTAGDPWVTQDKPSQNTRKLGKLVGCPEEPSTVLVRCLKQRPWKQLLGQFGQFYLHAILPPVPFGPIVEKTANPFLANEPLTLLKQKEVLDVPMIVSHTTHEGSFPVFMLKDFAAIDENWLQWAPVFLMFDATIPVPKWSQLGKKIKEYYFGQESISKETSMKLLELFGDHYFYVNGQQTVILQSSVVKAPIYYLKFNYSGDGNEAKIVGHGSDARFVFGQSRLAPNELTPNELQMKDIMVELLISYAETGKPTLLDADWPLVKNEKLSHLQINSPSEVLVFDDVDRAKIEFWKSFETDENIVKSEL